MSCSVDLEREGLKSSSSIDTLSTVRYLRSTIYQTPGENTWPDIVLKRPAAGAIELCPRKPSAQHASSRRER